MVGALFYYGRRRLRREILKVGARRLQSATTFPLEKMVSCKRRRLGLKVGAPFSAGNRLVVHGMNVFL